MIEPEEAARRMVRAIERGTAVYRFPLVPSLFMRLSCAVAGLGDRGVGMEE